MIRLISRKFIQILLLLPLLNWVGYHYALVHPRLFAGHSFSEFEGAYTMYVGQLLKGNLGEVGQVPIIELIVTPMRNSLILVVIALVVTIVAGMAFGVFSISPRTRRVSPTAVLLTSMGGSLPGFLLGAAIIGFMIYQTLYGGARETPLPLSGYGGLDHLILPILVLSARPALQIGKVTASLLENELQQPYIVVARSKGLSNLVLFWKHALPNVLSAVIITIGESMRLIVSGLIIVEAMFLWPGIGRNFMYVMGIRLDGRPPAQYFAHPELLAAIATILGAWLLLSDLVATTVAHAVDPRLREKLP